MRSARRLDERWLTHGKARRARAPARGEPALPAHPFFVSEVVEVAEQVGLTGGTGGTGARIAGEMQLDQLLIYADDLSKTYRRLNEAQARLQDAYVSTLAVLASAIEARDSHLVGHSRSVEGYSVAVGRQMGMRDGEIEALRRAALLHDIGKIGIPNATLMKPCKLDVSEWQTVRDHPERGYQMLRGLEFLGDALLGVRHHHERYDGTGYPARLQGERIPLIARVITACDALDAMLSDRPYRAAMPRSQALVELLDGRGLQFDSDVVGALVIVARLN